MRDNLLLFVIISIIIITFIGTVLSIKNVDNKIEKLLELSNTKLVKVNSDSLNTIPIIRINNRDFFPEVLEYFDTRCACLKTIYLLKINNNEYYFNDKFEFILKPEYLIF